MLRQDLTFEKNRLVMLHCKLFFPLRHFSYCKCKSKDENELGWTSFSSQLVQNSLLAVWSRKYLIFQTDAFFWPDQTMATLIITVSEMAKKNRNLCLVIFSTVSCFFTKGTSTGCVFFSNRLKQLILIILRFGKSNLSEWVSFCILKMNSLFAVIWRTLWRGILLNLLFHLTFFLIYHISKTIAFIFSWLLINQSNL